MKTLLIQLQPWRTSAGARVNVYVGDGPSSEGFGLNGVDWEPALTTRPVLTQELFNLDMDGKVQTGKARLTIALGMIQNVADARTLDYQGAPITIYSCDDLSWDRRVVEFTGNIGTARYDVDTGQLSIDAEASTQLIEKPLLTLSFSGGGGLNGDSGKRGTLRPAGFGIVEYIEPVWFDETYNIGQIDGYGNLLSVQKVMEGASDLGASIGDYASYTLLKNAIIAGAVPRGRWATSIADGCIGLGAPPAGVIGVNATFGYGKPGSMMQRIVQFHAGVPLGQIDTASFTAITTQVEAVLGAPANIGYWTADQRQVKDLFEAVASSCNSSPIVTLQGIVTVSRAVPAASSGTLNRDGSTEPRVLNWRNADTIAPYYQMKARTARPARVLNRDEVLYVDTIINMGVWNSTTGYRIGNTVFGPDGAEWLYINSTPTVGQALPAATYPPTALAANAYWQQLTRPVPTSGSMIGVADGATANISLVSIGSQAVTIVGNSISRAAGSGDFNACVRGTPLQGTHYAEVDIAATTNIAVVSLDDDATSTGQGSMLINFYYQASTGTWAIVSNNATQYTGTTTTGLTGKLRVSYDGIRYRCYINATQMGQDIAASASNLILWPKWHVYNGPNIVFTGIAAGPYNSNVWPDISGTGVPANNATANIILVGLNSNVRVTGNELLAVTSTDSSAYGTTPAYGSAEMTWKADAASNHNFRCGFVVAANIAGTTMATIAYGLETVSGTLYLDFGGVQTSLGAAVAGDRYRLTYDGLVFRAFVNGTEVAAARKTAAIGSTYFARVGLNGTAGVKLTEITFASFTQNDFADIGGTTAPAPNAGTANLLVAIGTGSTVRGNTVSKNATHGAFQGGAVGTALLGTAFISSNILNAAGGGGWDTYLALDDDNTSFSQAGQTWLFRINASGPGAGDAYLYSGGVLAMSAGSIPITANSRMALVYDGVQVAGYVDGVKKVWAAVSSGIKFFPKVIDYYNSATLAVPIIDVVYGPWSDNAWASIGGTGRPSDNAGTTLTFTANGAQAADILIQGNKVTRPVTTGGATWNAGAWSNEIFPGSIRASATIIQVAASEAVFGIDAAPSTGANYTDPDYSFLVSSGTLYTLDNIVASTINHGACAIGDRLFITYDGLYIRWYRTVAATGVTSLLRTATASPNRTHQVQICIANVGQGFSDIQAQPFTQNNWDIIGGTGRPSDNAGTTINLTKFASTNLLIVGNTVTQQNGGNWNVFYGEQVFPNAASMSFRIGSASAYCAGGLKAGAPPASDTSPLGISFSILVAGTLGQIYYYDGAGNATLASGTPAAGDLYTVAVDNLNAYFYRTTAAGVTTLLGSKPVTSGQSWRVVGQVFSLAMTDLMIQQGTDNLWASVGGVGRPGDNATQGLNSLKNGNAEQGLTNFWALDNGVGVATFDVDTANPRSGSYCFRITKPTTPDTINVVANAVQVTPGEVWTFRAWVRGSAATASGLYVGIHFKVAAPSDGQYVRAAEALGRQDIFGFSNGPVTTGYVEAVMQWTVPAGVYWASPAIYSWSGAPLVVYFDDVQFFKSVTIDRDMVDGTLYGRVSQTELTSNLLRLTQAGGGRRLGDVRNMPNIAAMNLSYKFTGAISYTAAAGTPATATISVGAGNTVAGSVSIAYNAMSAGVTGTGGTTVTFYLYVNDPTNAGGAQTLVATSTALNVYQGDGYIYIGFVDVFFPTSGTGGGGGSGGGGYCVLADGYVPTLHRGVILARHVQPGDYVMVLDEAGDGLEWELVTENRLAWEYGGTIIAETGERSTVSLSTPIRARGIPQLIRPEEIDGHELPVSRGGELGWSSSRFELLPEIIQVARIRCGQRVFAAGDVADAFLLAHNPKP